MRQVSVATTILPGHDHVSGLERLRGPVTVVRRCESLAELISVGRSGLADVLLVAGDTEQLTLTFLEAVAAGSAGRAPAVAALSEVATERERLDRLGVPSLAVGGDPAALAALLQDAATTVREPLAGSGAGARGGTGRDPEGVRRGRRAAPGPEQVLLAPDSGGTAGGGDAADGRTAAPAPGRADPAPAGPAAPAGAGPEAPGAAVGPDAGLGDVTAAAPGAGTDPGYGPVDGPGTAAAPPRTTAVWGPAGSPGRTTVAVNLAVELALAGRRTLLVDLDTYAASAGVLLGLLDESAGIAQACRRADQGGIDPEGVARCALTARVAGATLQVLTGLTRADRWPELRRGALDAVLEAGSAGWDEVVLDCGFSLEQDEELSFDVPAPQRNAATLAGLSAADRVLAVGTGDPVGLPRLLRALDELDRTGVAAAAHVELVVNQVRAEASGVAPQAQVRSVLERFAGDREVSAFLPWDRRSLDRAVLGGQVLAEAAPSSALRRAVAGLAGAPHPVEARSGWRRWVPRGGPGAAGSRRETWATRLGRSGPRTFH
ncbi:ParA family protein [Citricoccus sp. SGAir0253]|uniref:AAA family ATPase n=1 Tax=Citricoccus sp. SGAir0253 TaxID=2567881 RepID=UPI0010CD4B20|nr:ATPase [Citricoccus sp. SGAir0253]QCU77757.1 ParA family protein [Citricoccus sp. SGAir0253]